MEEELQRSPRESPELACSHRMHLLGAAIIRGIIWVFAPVIEVLVNEVADVETAMLEVANREPEQYVEERLKLVRGCDDF